MACKHQKSVGGQVEIVKFLVVKLFSSSLQLLLWEVTQVVVGLSYELLSTHEGVDKQSAATHHSWDPRTATVPALIHFSSWELRFLQSANSAPMWNVIKLDSSHDDFKYTSAEIVGK